MEFLHFYALRLVPLAGRVALYINNLEYYNYELHDLRILIPDYKAKLCEKICRII